MSDPRPELTDEWIGWARGLKHTKRGARLLELLIERGEVTTEEIRELLGERHPPSAVRDLKDRGVYVESARRGTMGLYRLDPTQTVEASGRKAFTTDFKKRLLRHYGSRCYLCGTPYGDRFLQPDHRVPQRVGGDEDDADRVVEDYMPVCRSCNRAKSFECERCPNWEERDVTVCQSCFWAIPDGAYAHVATRPERREVIVWSGEAEVQEHDALREQAGAGGVAEVLKRLARGLRRG